jgi:aspartyl-tRNA(Asn)/glutamyl-tRNA(Gln) amidotransferase subunit C
MSLRLDDVLAIAGLARLDLSRTEQEALLGQLNAFFAIVERMGTVDTSGVEPLYTPLSAVRDVRLPLRDDIVTETDQREALMRNAPAQESGLFLVPRVIE